MGLIRKLLGPRKRKKIMKKILRPKVDDWAHLGLKDKSPQYHTIWGSFESPWALGNGKNNEKYVS